MGIAGTLPGAGAGGGAGAGRAASMPGAPTLRSAGSPWLQLSNARNASQKWQQGADNNEPLEGPSQHLLASKWQEPGQGRSCSACRHQMPLRGGLAGRGPPLGKAFV